MQVEWYGQSAFRLSTDRQAVFVDPFGDMSGMAASRGLQFDYPPIEGVEADLVLVTHEHLDHNAIEAIAGSPPVLRSPAARLESPVGEVVGINSSHRRLSPPSAPRQRWQAKAIRLRPVRGRQTRAVRCSKAPAARMRQETAAPPLVLCLTNPASAA